MNRDVKELRELGYTDTEIANILADGDEKIADEIVDEIKRDDAAEIIAAEGEDEDDDDVDIVITTDDVEK